MTLADLVEETAEEIDTLRAMLDPHELSVDEVALEQRLQLLPQLRDASADTPPPRVNDLTVTLQLSDEDSGCRIDVELSLPLEYPQATPRVRLRCRALSSAVEAAAQATLLAHLTDEHPHGEPCLWAAAEYAREAVAAATAAAAAAASDVRKNVDHAEAGDSEAAGGDVLQREFIYFHHIYNKHKRRDIVAWARELRLSGFSLVGKPGLVCVEGTEADVREYVQRLRRLPWQKIQSKHVELETPAPGETLASLRRFPPMDELAVAAHGPRGNHGDFGEVRVYLRERGLEQVFVEIFGVT